MPGKPRASAAGVPEHVVQINWVQVVVTSFSLSSFSGFFGNYQIQL